MRRYVPISGQSAQPAGEPCLCQGDPQESVPDMEASGPPRILGALGSPEWRITAIDENLGVPDD